MLRAEDLLFLFLSLASKKVNLASVLRLSIITIFCVLNLSIQAQLIPSFGGSRTGTTGFQFLKIAPDAYSAGMSESVIALSQEAHSLFWNPAGISRVDSQRLHVEVGHLSYFSGISMQNLALVSRLGESSYIGLGLLYLNSGAMDVTTEFQPFGTGQQFYAYDLAVGLSYARTLTENFSFGVTSKFVQEGIAGINTNTVLFDFGFQYDVGLANTRFAVTLTNFGFNATPSGEILNLDLNGENNISEFEQISAPAIFRLGIAWDALKKEKHALTVSGQLNHPTDNNETYDLGAEYIYRNLLSLRTGYSFGQDEFSWPAAGFGIKLKKLAGLKLDYAFTAKERLGTYHRISLGASLL